MFFDVGTRLERVFNGPIPVRPDLQQDALSAQLQRDQFISWVRHGLVMYAIGTSVAACLLLYLKEDLYNSWLQYAVLSLMASYCLMFFVSIRVLHKYNSLIEVQDSLSKLRAKFGLLRMFIGCSWGATLVVMNTVATSGQRCLLFGTAVALLSTSVFGGSFAYGLTVWLPIMAGCTVSTIIIFPQTGPAPLICLLLYGILTLFSIFDLSKKLRDFTLNGFELKSRNEIIKIVLNDFEEVASDWLWETNAEMILVNISPRLSSLLFPEVLPPDVQERVDLRALVLSSVFLGDGEEQIDAFVQRLAARQPFSRLVLPISINETNHWWMLSGKPRFNIKGEFIGYHGVGSDVTESHGFNQRIEYIARHDALTGTLNRSRFNEILAERFEILDDCEVGFCLISFDLDNFKGVNDTFGHAIGDELLQIVAERIIQSVNFGDVVARIGGDEFHVLSDCESKEDGMELANRIIRELNRPVVIHDTRITTGASAGLSYAPWDVKDPVQMLKQSDLALYHAKRKGRGLACQYDDMIEFEMQVRAKLEADLQAALAHNQFELLFQPILSLHSSKIVGVEALIRWQHPTRGRIFPDEFIATAERTGLIEPIGRWVITEACRVAASLPSHVTMSINLSPIQLQNPKLVDLTAKTIQITGLDPARIEFEITESSVMDTEGSSLATFEALSRLGIKFALDDFGTGHSSLSLLHRLKFDRLKIDRSFTAGMLTDAVNRTLVEKTIELSQALNIEVTVEGIETEAQAAFLRKYAGLCGQGYLFGRPSRIQDIVFDLAPAEILRPEKPGARSNIVALERRLRDG